MKHFVIGSVALLGLAARKAPDNRAQTPDLDRRRPLFGEGR